MSSNPFAEETDEELVLLFVSESSEGAKKELKRRLDIIDEGQRKPVNIQDTDYSTFLGGCKVL